MNDLRRQNTVQDSVIGPGSEAQSNSTSVPWTSPRANDTQLLPFIPLGPEANNHFDWFLANVGMDLIHSSNPAEPNTTYVKQIVP
jgi:hypothetical protein